MMKTIVLCGVLGSSLLLTQRAQAEDATETEDLADSEEAAEPEAAADAETVETEPSAANESPQQPVREPASEPSPADPPEQPQTQTREDRPDLSLLDGANANDGRRPGFGLWIGGLLSGLVGFGVGVAGMALVFSEACATESCPEWIAFTAIGVTAFIAGIVMVTVGRRRMRRARALPEFMHSEAGGWRLEAGDGFRRRWLRL